MIFVTIGTQCSFDRLIQYIDELAPSFKGKEIIAQICEGAYKPKHMQTISFISPTEFDNYLQNAELVVSHAGMGTILQASQLSKPLIVFPRSGKLKETRNDHQLATCKALEQQQAVNVAYDKDDLEKLIKQFYAGNLQPTKKITAFASPTLISSLQDFIAAQ